MSIIVNEGVRAMCADSKRVQGPLPWQEQMMISQTQERRILMH